MARPRIAAACPIPAERAALIDWLEAAGCEAVPMLDLSALAATLETRPMEALIADVALVSEAALPDILRTLGINRPLVLLGDPAAATPALTRHAGWLDRPVTLEALTLAVALALAEGRPARQSPRKTVTPIPASVENLHARVLDVSREGVRVEIGGARPVLLPPFFTLCVPAFNVASTVRRVWVRQPPGGGAIWCGGRLHDDDARAAAAWRQLVETAPSSAIEATLIEVRPFW